MQNSKATGSPYTLERGKYQSVILSEAKNLDPKMKALRNFFERFFSHAASE